MFIENIMSTLTVMTAVNLLNLLQQKLIFDLLKISLIVFDFNYSTLSDYIQAILNAILFIKYFLQHLMGEKII